MSKKLLLVLVALVAAATFAMAQSTKFANGDTLRILTANVEVDDKDYNTFAKNPSDFPILQKVEELTGLKLVIEAVNSNDYGTVLLPRIAAKTNLPDVFVQGGGFDIVKYATDGVIIPIEGLIKANAPETVALWKQYPDIQHDTTAPDSHIYGYPGRVSPYDNSYNILGMVYRSDWATKLGIKDPDTIADWYKMLTAFLTKDPNGNGKADEIPYLGQSDNNLYCFANAYGLSPWNDWWSVTKAGKVVFDFTADETKAKAKAWLTEMNKWFKEKLIDQEYLVDHGDKMDAEVLTNIGGAKLAWTAAADDWNSQMKKDTPSVKWIVAYPPKGPQGDRGSEQYGPVNNERWMVTTACKNPVLAVKWMNFMFATQQGMDLRNWGIEGVTYTVQNGKHVFTDAANNSRYGAGQAGTYLTSLGASRWPWVWTKESIGIIYGSTTPEYQARLATIEKNGWFRRGFYFGSMAATKGESAATSGLLSDISTYRNEMVQKFIVGTEPLANYDAFVAQLKKLGIDAVSNIKQIQYNRFMGK